MAMINCCTISAVISKDKSLGACSLNAWPTQAGTITFTVKNGNLTISENTMLLNRFQVENGNLIIR